MGGSLRRRLLSIRFLLRFEERCGSCGFALVGRATGSFFSDRAICSFCFTRLRRTQGRFHRGEIDLAAKRFEDFKQRMDATPRVPPRAAGSDAP